MSKKKVSGNTMTLKDFHGGSIPTDLPLPSAPGVTVRPMDRSSFDRPSSRGSLTGRSHHQSRPHSSPATRHFDDKTPFLSHTAHIGRNFDEDERKPLDGVMAPRRTISDESVRVQLTRVEPKPEYGPSSRQGLGPVQFPNVGAAKSYSTRVYEGSGVNSQNSGGNSDQGFGGVYPNAWAARKEVALGVSEPVQSAWAVPCPVSKLTHASALEKVSSGRWQSKQLINYQTDFEIVGSSEPDSGSQLNSHGNISNNRGDLIGGREYHDSTLARPAERGLSIQGGRLEIPDYDSIVGWKYSAGRVMNSKIDSSGVPQVSVDGKFGGSELQGYVSSDTPELPKLKLLPRSKPLESQEHTVVNYTQVAADFPAENVKEVYGKSNHLIVASANIETGKQVIERPKLNLRPRSQPVEQLECNVERDRSALFGGARPRELVLKERGIDDIVIDNPDLIQNSKRNEHNVTRIERIVGHTFPTHYTGKSENPPRDQRFGNKAEREDNDRVDPEQIDIQKRNWRNENRRINKETERQKQQLVRPPSPETWRKPIEPPKAASPDSTGLRYGKGASAFELCQTFSSSVSDSKVADNRIPNQRSLPGITQMPFSQLTGSGSRPQINGY